MEGRRVGESGTEKIWRRFKEEPWVGIGNVASANEPCAEAIAVMVGGIDLPYLLFVSGALATAGVLLGGFGTCRNYLFPPPFFHSAAPLTSCASLLTAAYAYIPGRRHLYQRIWWTRIALQVRVACLQPSFSGTEFCLSFCVRQDVHCWFTCGRSALEREEAAGGAGAQAIECGQCQHHPGTRHHSITDGGDSPDL